MYTVRRGFGIGSQGSDPSVYIGDRIDTVNGPVKGPVNGPERLFVIIKLNPGLRKTALAELSGLSAMTVKRYVETVLAKRIEFRGAPKTGGYYCKEA